MKNVKKKSSTVKKLSQFELCGLRIFLDQTGVYKVGKKMIAAGYINKI